MALTADNAPSIVAIAAEASAAVETATEVAATVATPPTDHCSGRYKNSAAICACYLGNCYGVASVGTYLKGLSRKATVK